MKTKKKEIRSKKKTEKESEEELQRRGFKQLLDETVASLEKQGEIALSAHLKQHFHFTENGNMRYTGKGFKKVSETKDVITYTFEP